MGRVACRWLPATRPTGCLTFVKTVLPMRMTFIPPSGFKSGKLTVGFVYRRGKGFTAVCQCECGNKAEIAASLLQPTGRGRTTCGGDAHRKDGHTLHPLGRVWQAMIARCHNQSDKDYKNYGAKGVRVCAEWHDPWKFYAYMPPRPSPKHTIDRIDPTGDYKPGNVRWATPQEQANNKRKTNRLPSNGEEVSPTIYWRRHGLGSVEYKTFLYRLRSGWDLAAACKPSTIPRK